MEKFHEKESWAGIAKINVELLDPNSAFGRLIFNGTMDQYTYLKDVLKKVEKFRRKIDTASDQSESDKSTGSPNSRLNKYSRIVDSLVKKHCSYKSNRVDSKELQAFRRTLPMYTQRDKHRKQVINKMKADMKAHKQQNIDKAAHDEK